MECYILVLQVVNLKRVLFCSFTRYNRPMKTGKKIITSLALIFFGIYGSFSQCADCTTLKRDDGTTINQCPTKPVAADQEIQIGLSALTNGTDFFVAVSVRFRYSVQRILSPLGFHLDNNKMVKLTLSKQQELTAGGSNFIQGFFIVTADQLAILKSSNIKIVHIILSDGKLRPIEALKNPDVLKIGFNCLN